MPGFKTGRHNAADGPTTLMRRRSDSAEDPGTEPDSKFVVTLPHILTGVAAVLTAAAAFVAAVKA